MILKSKIFRAYDIRGEAFIDFDEDGFFVTAAAFGKYISDKFQIDKPKIFVSGDGRTSMDQLFPAIISGLESANCEVAWGGVITTPMNYFAFHEGGFDAAIQISASHNPPQDNGLKLTDKNGAVCGEEIQKIRALTECVECNLSKEIGECRNQCQPEEILRKYLEKLQKILPPQKPKKIVIDAGNGVSGMHYPQILKQFGHEIIELYCDLDGNFPNHQPDPERPENLKDLIQKVQEENADYGFAFDGDGDRVGIVLKDGTIISADKIIFILATDFLSRNPEEKIVLDIMCSPVLINKIQELEGQVVLSKTGHSYIEEAMHKTNARLGGEQSGHFMFGEDFYGHDDALLACLRFLSAMETKPSLLKEVTDKWPQLLEFSEKIDAPDEKKFEIVKNVETRLIMSLTGTDVTANSIDGLRLDWSNFEWAIVRCSNTSPKIAVRIEAKNQESLKKKKEIILDALNNSINKI